MLHTEFRRIQLNAKTAVLFIHGINGTPNHFRDFVELVPPECSVVNLLLKGHGKGVSDFGSASMEQWKAQVNEEVESLLDCHEHLLIAAHSMGALFAIRQAIKHPERIKALFLMAVPLKPFIRFRMIRTSVLMHLGRVREDDVWTQAAVKAYGINLERKFWKYIPWIDRYLELLKEIKAVRKNMSALETPSYCYQSQKDELVSLKSGDILRGNKWVTVRILENSGHFYYDKRDYALLLEDFRSFINN